MALMGQADDEGSQSRQLLGLEALRTMSKRIHTIENASPPTLAARQPPRDAASGQVDHM
jgi:hypothetical protein